MAALKEGTSVIVYWDDPNIDVDAQGEAKDLDALDLESSRTASIGFFVKEEGGIVVIATDFYPLGKRPVYRCIQRIYRKLIVDVVPLQSSSQQKRGKKR